MVSLLIKLSNSIRVARLVLKSPSIVDEVTTLFCFSTPLMIIHRCFASMITATP